MPTMHRLSPSPLSIEVATDRAHSDGAYVLLDVRAAGGTVLPPHVRAAEDATLLVLEGELSVASADLRRVVRAGEPVVLPRATPCRIEARTDVRVLVLAVPAGLESLAELAADVTAADPDDLAALLSAAGVSLIPATWGHAA
jgi:quercetin dioxygenase-like cupin family protein